MDLASNDIDWGTITPDVSQDTADDWPTPIQPFARIGVLGQILDTVEPHTESDPNALYLTLLTLFGSILGRTAHFCVESDTHFLNLFSLHVGNSSKGRKGTGLNRCLAFFSGQDLSFDRAIAHGLSSGEGLINLVRDPIERQQPVKEGGRTVGYESVVVDDGADEKRALIVEAEYGSTLRVLNREGNILSAVLRNAWDGAPLRVLTRNNPLRATDAHISLVGNITRDELRMLLTRTEMGNGYANRHLFVCSKRSRLLPLGGGEIPNHEGLRTKLGNAIGEARQVGEITRDAEATERWCDAYAELSGDVPGLLGSVTARSEAQTMRLACLLALSDFKREISLRHLNAALEVWRYCFESARCIFGQQLGDEIADVVLAELKRRFRNDGDGLTRTEISRLFFGNKSSAEIERALSQLASLKLARRAKDEYTRGRPIERWFLGSAAD